METDGVSSTSQNVQRTPPPPPPPPAPPAATGAEAASGSREAVAGGSAVNERRAADARAAGVAAVEPPKAATPAMPAAAQAKVDDIYKDAGAAPPSQDAKTVTIDGKQYDNTYDTGHMNADGSPARVTSEEAKKLDDPATRTQTSLDVGRRIAQSEGLTTALGGQANRAAAEKTWNGMSGDEQAKLAGEQSRGKSLTDAVYGAKSQSARDKIVEDIGDKAKIDVPSQRGFGVTYGSPTSDANTESKAANIARELQNQANAGQNGRSTLEQRQENTKELAKEVAIGVATAPLGGPLARIGGKALEGAGALASKLAPEASAAVSRAAASVAEKTADIAKGAVDRAKSLFGGAPKTVEFQPTAEVAARRVENARLVASGQLQKDAEKVGVSPERLEAMAKKELPLSFASKEQFAQFKSEMHAALDKAGLGDAHVELRGTSTSFYSENPGKALGHHFDAKGPADVDLSVQSKSLVDKMDAAGVQPHEKIPGIYKYRDTMAQFPALKEFADKWEKILGREVNFVGSSARGATVVDPAAFTM